MNKSIVTIVLSVIIFNLLTVNLVYSDEVAKKKKSKYMDFTSYEEWKNEAEYLNKKARKYLNIGALGIVMVLGSYYLLKNMENPQEEYTYACYGGIGLGASICLFSFSFDIKNNKENGKLIKIAKDKGWYRRAIDEGVLRKQQKKEEKDNRFRIPIPIKIQL